MTWIERAWRALATLILSNLEFTADDIRQLAGVPDPGHNPNNKNNRIGAFIREARARGFIESTGRIIKSTSPERRGGMIQIWRATPAGSLWAEALGR